MIAGTVHRSSSHPSTAASSFNRRFALRSNDSRFTIEWFHCSLQSQPFPSIRTPPFNLRWNGRSPNGMTVCWYGRESQIHPLPSTSWFSSALSTPDSTLPRSTLAPCCRQAFTDPVVWQRESLDSPAYPLALRSLPFLLLSS